jgi:protein arginine kinase activator
MLTAKCIKCSRPAVVHLTEVGTVNQDNGVKQIIQIHLCLEHAMEAGLLNLSGGATLFKPDETTSEPESETSLAAPAGDVLSAAQAIVPAGAKGAPGEALACPVCGMTWKMFQKTGRLNCPNDYIVFEKQLTNLAQKVHEGRTQHMGKIPTGSDEQTRLVQARRMSLQQRLGVAVKSENYEEAAKLRDELKHLDTASPPGAASPAAGS